MLKYEILSAGTIEVDLGNGYKIMTIGGYNKPTEGSSMVYNIKMLLGSNEFDTYQLITDNYSSTIVSSPKTIRNDMAQFVTDLANNNFFNHAIEIYNYEQNCVSIGDEVLDIAHMYDK